MSKEEFQNLIDDVRLHGLLNPIVELDGKILDGRHRHQACLITGCPARFVSYKGSDPLGFVIAHNLKRRHLTPSQLSMVAAKLANVPRGQPEKKSANLPITQTKAAKTLGVSCRSVTTATKIEKESPALAAKVSSGEVTLNAASKELAKSKAEAAPKEARRDKKGYAIPVKIIPLWDRAEGEAKSALQLVSKLKSVFTNAQAAHDPAYRDVDYKETYDLLANLTSNIKLVLPYGVCTLCQGVIPLSCKLCKGKGYLNEFAYDQFGSEEVKTIRAKTQK